MSIEDLLAQVPVAMYGSEGIRRAQVEASVGDETKIEALREQCETIIGFTEYRYPRYRTSKVHRFIAAQLERVERGEIDRLMLRLPPRHGKSELASRNFPAYCIGRKPWRQFIAASATADLAREFGREVRNNIETEAYQAVYSTRLAQDFESRQQVEHQRGRQLVFDRRRRRHPGPRRAHCAHRRSLRLDEGCTLAGHA